MEEKKIKAAIEQMQKTINAYIEGANYSHYKEVSLVYEGKADGMREALEILKKAVKEEK